jgi:hypothetical protein
MNIKNLLCLVSAAALATTVAAQTGQPSLPELAKAEKQRRAQLQKARGAAKVYTESDRTGGSSDQAASEPAPAGTAAAPAAAGIKKKEKTPEELAADKQKEWADKVKGAQDQIRDLEANIARNERTLGSLINITPQRADLANSVEADKKKLADLKASLVNLEDERRRAGIPRPR